MAAHRAAPAGAGTPGSDTRDPGLATRVSATRNAQAAVERRLRRVRKMLDDVVNAVFHVGDAATCELRVERRTRGENMQWVAVVKRSGNLDKQWAQRATARAGKAEKENKLLQKRLKLKQSKVGTH